MSTLKERFEREFADPKDGHIQRMNSDAFLSFIQAELLLLAEEVEGLKAKARHDGSPTTAGLGFNRAIEDATALIKSRAELN
jgi:hypothetical protein